MPRIKTKVLSRSVRKQIVKTAKAKRIWVKAQRTLAKKHGLKLHKLQSPSKGQPKYVFASYGTGRSTKKKR